jgi:uncharacterized protein (DUF3084 family)|tara:strand:+ start:5810 stop:6187 length:378 start_codon:yes stop_codon:yes gene_type:complete
MQGVEGDQSSSAESVEESDAVLTGNHFEISAFKDDKLSLLSELEKERNKRIAGVKHLKALERELEISQREAKIAREDAEFAWFQLRQAQEELVEFFDLSQSQSEILSSYSDLQQRIAILISESNN